MQKVSKPFCSTSKTQKGQSLRLPDGHERLCSASFTDLSSCLDSSRSAGHRPDVCDGESHALNEPQTQGNQLEG